MNCSPFRPSPFAFACGALAATVTAIAPAPASANEARETFVETHSTLQASPKAVLDEAWQIVNRDYVDGSFNRVDWQEVRRELLSQNYSSRQEAYNALRRAIGQLRDPYTRFLDPQEFAALTERTDGELSGIGLQIQRDDTTSLVAGESVPDSPAERAGLLPGDRILEIDGVSTEGMTPEAASERIRGEVGTSVVLSLWRSGRGQFEVTLVRSIVAVPTVFYHLRAEGDARVGYIRLSEFNAHAAEQMHRAIRDLSGQGADAFVLDLRGNPGGLLQASIQIARMWMENGAIVRTVDREGNSEEVEATRTALSTHPLAVLVDGGSASASEILAGALQDNRRATIVGTQTFGKALVQSVHSLSDGSGLAVTVAHYYTPAGTDISERGINPDIAVRLTREQQRLLVSDPNVRGTRSDPYYQQALTLLQGQLPIAQQAAN